MFDAFFFANPQSLWAGIVTGLVFGFLLQRAHVTRADTIIGQFLLRDFTVIKVMLTAMIVGGVGVYAMLQLGMIEGLHVKGANLLVNTLGGVIFGLGMATLGYCPGTAIAAIGDGSKDAGWGALGMIAGAALYAEAYPWVKSTLTPIGDLGKVTLVSATHLSPWWFFVALAIAASVGFWRLERYEAQRRSAPGRSAAHAV